MTRSVETPKRMRTSSIPLLAGQEESGWLKSAVQPSLRGFDRSQFPSDEPLNKYSRIISRQQSPSCEEDSRVSSPLMAHSRETNPTPPHWKGSNVVPSLPQAHRAGHIGDSTRPARFAHRTADAYRSVPLGSHVRAMSNHLARMQLTEDCEALLEPQSTPSLSDQDAEDDAGDSERTFTNTVVATQCTSTRETKPDGYFRQIIFVIVVCSAQFLSLAGLAQTFAPLNVLSDSLDIGNQEVMAWPTAAYSLALGSCILMAGRLGDLLGHRIVFITGWLWFGFSSVACGFSFYGGWRMLTACRAVQGVGPAFLVPNALALISRRFPAGTRRNISISLFAGLGPCGFATGAVASSLFSELLWWPWQFWSMAFVCIALSFFTPLVIPSESDATFVQSWVECWRLFDLFGACTGIAGLTLVGIGLIQGPIVGFSKPYIIVFLGLGVVLACIFCYVELRVAAKPLVPLRALRLNVGFTLVCICAGWGSQGIWLFFLFLRWESIQGYGPIAACAHLWPMAPVGLTAALTVGLLLKRLKLSTILTVAMLAFFLGCILLATAPRGHEYAFTLSSILITPIGMNWSFPTAVILISNEVDREHQGIAASLVATVLNFSISTGLGVAGNIVQSMTPAEGLFAAYRAAWYFGAALAGLGLSISLCFVLHFRKKK